jgi:hypothetical protein
MNIARKLEIAKQAIVSLTQHEDEDSVVRDAAIANLTDFLASEKAEIAARNAARVAEALGTAE